MYVACSTLCFAAHPLDEALRTIREMNFAKVDLAASEASLHLKPSQIAADPALISKRLKAANVPIAAIHAEFEKPEGDAAKAQLRSVCRLARHLAVPLISTAAAAKGSDMAAEANRLKDWLKVANAEGVLLTVETHRDTLTGEPETALDLCHRVPGLGLTLDPSHYVTSGSKNYDDLFEFVKHVRLRDSGPESFQVRVGQGELEYGRIISQLDKFHYNRALSVDVRDLPNGEFPVEPEVRKLKYLLESLV